MPDRPLAVDLFAGLFGWSEGLTAEGWRCVGFDLEDMHAKFGMQRPPHCQLVIQDVRTICGSQLKTADLIVCSPPCQEFSFMAMPWFKGKEKEQRLLEDASAEARKKLTELFDVCFRIQREACEAAGRHIPMIVENVRGAQKWVGRSRWAFGSYHLWGDVPALMPIPFKGVKGKPYETGNKNASGSWFAVSHSGVKAPGMNWSDPTKRGQDFTRLAGKRAQEAANGGDDGFKVPNDDGRRTDHGKGARFTSRDCGLEASGIKCGGDWFNQSQPSISRMTSSKSPARKMASAMIAKIPLPLSTHIARVFHPNRKELGV